jgi:1,4-dihydroxy-2-naphthoate octaprenyltransferase
MTLPAEPSLAALPNPLLRYVLATRPAFLSVTFAGVALGLACAHAGGATLDPLAATVTLLFALVAHAGVNVVNDYYDARNGSDAANVDRVFPFTGGSRFIQNGVLSERLTGIFGHGLLLAVIPAGLWLAHRSGDGLVGVGLAGLAVGWAYSAPPLKLASRGLGELAVTAGWLLVVVGSEYVQSGRFSLLPVAAGLPYALLVANVLYINQFPDIRADGRAGKRTLVVRLGAAAARYGYAALIVATYGALVAAVVAGILPWPALAACLAAPLSLAALAGLWRNASVPGRLAPAIKLTIGAAMAHGLLATLALAALT